MAGVDGEEKEKRKEERETGSEILKVHDNLCIYKYMYIYIYIYIYMYMCLCLCTFRDLQSGLSKSIIVSTQKKENEA